MKLGNRWKQWIGIICAISMLAGNCPTAAVFAAQETTVEDTASGNSETGSASTTADEEDGNTVDKSSKDDSDTGDKGIEEQPGGEDDASSNTGNADKEEAGGSDTEESAAESQTQKEQGEESGGVQKDTSDSAKSDTSKKEDTGAPAENSESSQNTKNETVDSKTNDESSNNETTEKNGNGDSGSDSKQENTGNQNAGSDTSETDSLVKASDIDIYQGTKKLEEKGVVLDQKSEYATLRAQVEGITGSISYEWKVEDTDDNNSGKAADSVRITDGDKAEATFRTKKGEKGGRFKIALTVSVTDGEKVSSATVRYPLTVYNEYNASLTLKKTSTVSDKEENIEGKKVNVSDTLYVKLSLKDDAEQKKAAFSYQLQKKDSKGGFSAITGEEGTFSDGQQASYIIPDEGTYRVLVESSDEAESYRQPFTWTSDEITAEKIPVSIKWKDASRSYNGSSSFKYNETGTVTRKDGKGDSWEVSLQKDLVLELINSDTNEKCADAGTYKSEIKAADVLKIGVDELDPNVYEIEDAPVTLIVKPASTEVTLTVADKDFDNTTAIIGDEIRAEWNLEGTSLSEKNVSVLFEDGDNTRNLSAEDLQFASVGDVDQTTKVAVQLKNSDNAGKFVLAVDKVKNSNYTVKVSFGEASINKVEIEDAHSVASVDGTYYTDAEGVVWVQGDEQGEGKVGLRAGNGYQIAAGPELIAEDNTAFSEVIINPVDGNGTDYDTAFFARDEQGRIAKVHLTNIKVDSEAPVADLQNVKATRFGNFQNQKSYTNTYVIKDTGAGIREVAVRVLDAASPDEVTYDSENPEWQKAELGEGSSGEYTVSVSVPKFGYAYIYTEDNAGNKTVTQSHIVVYEKAEPAAPVIECADSDTPTKQKGTVTISAADRGDAQSSYGSGVKSIDLKLLDEENRDISGDAAFELKGNNPGLEITNNTIVRTGDAPDQTDDLEAVKAYQNLAADITVKGNSLNGKCRLVVTVRDYCGNEKEGEQILVFDNTAPSYSVELTDGLGSEYRGTYYYSAKEGGLKIQFSDDYLSNGGYTYSATLFDTKNHKIEKKLDQASGKEGTLTFTAAEISASENNLEDGKLTLKVTAVDGAGNTAGKPDQDKSTASILKDNGEISFILDTTAPVVTGSKTELSNKKRRPKINSKKRTVTYPVSFSTVVEIDEKNLCSDTDAESITAGFSGTPDSAHYSIETEYRESGESITFTCFGSDTFGKLALNGKDLAGNMLQISNSFVNGSTGANAVQDKWVTSGSDIQTEYSRILNDSTPHITVEYTTADGNLLSAGRVIENADGSNTAYYNQAIQIKVTGSGIDKDDYEGFTISVLRDGQEDVDLRQTLSEKGNEIKLLTKDDGVNDGEYRIVVQGINNAGTAPEIAEKSPKKGGKTINHKKTNPDDETAFSMDSLLVLDTVCPQAEVTLTPEKGVVNKSRNTAYGNRYYFNGKHAFQVKINDRNIALPGMEGIPDEAGHVSAFYAEILPMEKDSAGNDQGKGYTDASNVEFAERDFKNQITGSYDDAGKTITFNAAPSQDGVRQYMVTGEDLAGNPVEYVGVKEIDESFEGSGENRATPFVTYKVVTDTAAPVADLTVKAPSSESGVTIYEMDTDGWVYISDPYCAEKTAQITVSLKDNCAERTPYRMHFTERIVKDGTESTSNVPVSPKPYGVTGVRQITDTVEAPSVFQIEGIEIEDLAGNKGVGRRATHKIYLDASAPSVNEPTADSAPPAIALYPEQDLEKYGKDGTPLFADDVVFHVKVVEPDRPETDKLNSGSTGLKYVTYDLIDTARKGSDGKNLILESGTLYSFADASGSNPEKSDGTKPDGSDNRISDDGQFMYEWEDSIKIKKDYNRNSLSLIIRAADNVNNKASADSVFGIDATDPKMTLSYDNNDVTNGMYFNAKNGRTATITVTERNFDKEKVSIYVEADSNGSNAENAGGVSDPDYWKYDPSRWSLAKEKDPDGEENGDKDVWTYSIKFRQDGHYKLYIKASDGSDNKIIDRAGRSAAMTWSEETAAAPFEFVLDRKAPNVSVVMERPSPDEEDKLFYYRADNCGIKVRFDDNGQNIGVEGGNYQIAISDTNTDDLAAAHFTVKTGADIDYKTVLKEYDAATIAQGNNRLLHDGPHTIIVTAEDAAGNRAVKVTSSDLDYNQKSTGCVFKEGSDTENYIAPSASFILDTVSPEVTEITTTAAENISGQSYPLTDEKVYSDTDSAYYNKNIDVTLMVEDMYLRSGQFEGAVQKDEGTNENSSLKASLKENEKGLQAVYSLKGDHVYSDLLLKGQDKAGNPLVLSGRYTRHCVTDADDLWQAAEDTVAAVHNKTVDRTAPSIQMLYESIDYANMYTGETKGKATAYYNKPITVSMSFEDNYELDGKKIYAGAEGAETNQDNAFGKTHYDAVPIIVSRDGRYTFTAYGTDRALNPSMVEEMIPEEAKQTKHVFENAVEAGAFENDLTKGQKAFKPAYEIVLDQIAPTFKLAVKSEKSSRKGLNTQGNRYYFNKPYTATFTVSDTNYDVDRIVVKRGAVKGNTYNSQKASVPDSVSDYDITINCTEKNAKIFADTEDTGGVYRYIIYGSDKAGNALVPSVDNNLEGTTGKVVDKKTEQGRGSEEDTADRSVHVVVDRIKPQGELIVSEGNIPYYRMETDESLSISEPYRDETKANIRFTVNAEVERTPVNISYTIDSTVKDQKKKYSNSTYQYNLSASTKQSGKQIFRITEFTITDLAGNLTTCSSPNKIYLDEEPPKIDELAPVIKVVATAKAGTKDAKGQDLFKSDVSLRVTVEDPDEKRSSSGIGLVTFDVYRGNTRISRDTKTLHNPNTQKREAGAKKKDVSYKDEKLDYLMTKTVTVPAAGHNYNDLSVVVTAYDNAGRSSKKTYPFGIDTTSPRINVEYLNNSAENGKYFKADRTAIVKVTERNFDPSKIHITTQSSASRSGWTRSPGKADNGDDDVWTCRIVYSADGNYTFGVTGEDIVNHPASVNYSGTQPRDFVIDKQAPNINVTYNTNAASNGKYYNVPRTATITVTDVNFNGRHDIRVNASGGGAAPGVNFNGKSAVLPFTQDGIYSFAGTVTDMAGNVSRVTINEPEFVIDQVKPEIKIEGVKDLSANRDPLHIILKITDTNPTKEGFEPELRGTSRGLIDISDFGERTDIEGGVQYTLKAIDIDDYYTLKFKGVDLAGNEAEMSISFSENQHGTTFQFAPEGVEDPQSIIGNSTNQRFKPSFILHDVDEVTVLSVQMNGKEVPYTYKGNRVTIDDELESDGMYSFTISTRDAAGHNNTMSPVEFRVDRTKPVLTQEGLGSGVKYYVDAFDITFRHDNPEDFFSLIEMNGVKLKEGDYVVNPDGSVTIHVDRYQPYNINVEVSDAAGNTSERASFDFELTSNILIRWYLNKPLFVGSLAAIAGALAWFLLVFLKRRDEEDEEEQQAG